MKSTHPAIPEHRRNLLKLLALGGVLAGGLAGLTRTVLAMGADPVRKQGIYRLEGQVRFNGKELQVGDVPTLPLDVVTGPKSWTIFVIGEDAYYLRSDSRLKLDGRSASRAGAIDLTSGKLLSVFGKGEPVTFKLPTAVVGIRGTGLYCESEPDRAYVCLCYGWARMEPKARPDLAEQFRTRHHESPRLIYPDRIETATVYNHSDDELILLESLTGRIPPFALADGYGQDGILAEIERSKRY